MSIDGLIPDRPNRDELPGQLFAGVVRDTPDAADDEIRVRLNADRQTVGPIPFAPKPGITEEEVAAGGRLPSKGDRALVAFDDSGRPWLVAWNEE